MKRWPERLCGGLITLSLLGCASSARITAVTVADGPRGVIELSIVAQFPHDAAAFTQGLEFLDEETLLESTGGVGTSEIREVDPGSGAVVRREPLPGDRFGEGLTVGPDGIVQLTWTSGVALLRDPESLEVIRELPLDTEGWGVVWDDAGDRFITSDGSSILRFRDRSDFSEIGRVEVSRDGEPVEMLNELELVDGVLYANVWKQDVLLRIDPATGEVTGSVDASELAERVGPRSDEDGVLNGVAHHPDDPPNRLWVTGKEWPTMFVVDLIET